MILRKAFWLLLAAGCGIVPMARAYFEDVQHIDLRGLGFADNDELPSLNTCDGKKLSPVLKWSRDVASVQSFAVMMEDPDASAGEPDTYWLLYDIPPTVYALQRGVPTMGKLASGEKHGTNDFGELGYSPPCPEYGQRRRFRFRIFALDRMLEKGHGLDRDELLEAMDGHILGEGSLTTTYQRKSLQNDGWR